MDGGGSGSFGRGSFDVTALSSTVDSAAETSPIGHGSETAEPQQDSRPRGGQVVCGPGAVSAPSNQLKAKRDGWMDGWGWNGVEALAVALAAPRMRPQKHLPGHGCETAEPKRGGPLVCGPGAVSAPSNQLNSKRDGWMDGWMDGGGMGWKLWPWP